MKKRRQESVQQQARFSQMKLQVAQRLGLGVSAPPVSAPLDASTASNLVNDMDTSTDTAVTSSDSPPRLSDLQARASLGQKQAGFTTRTVTWWSSRSGFAAIVRIRQDTKDLCQLTPSSVPPHVTAMLGEVQELFKLTSRSAALLSIPNLQSLCAFEGSSFDNTRFSKDPTPELLGMDTSGMEYYMAEKHPSGDRRMKNGTLYLVYISMSKVYDDYVSRYFDFVLPEIARLLASGETIRFVPKFKRRRGQEQLRLAFQSGDGEVWECEKCDPPTYHVVHTEHKGKKHKCRSRVGVAQPHKMIADVGVTISTSLSDQPKRLQRNLEVLRDYRQQRPVTSSVYHTFSCCQWSRVLAAQPKQLQLCPVVLHLHSPDSCVQSAQTAETQKWKLLVTPPGRSDWTRVTAQMYIEDRTNKLWCKSPPCGKHKSQVKRSPELKHSVTKVPDLKKLHCFEATSTPGTLQVSFFRDENKQKFVFLDERSSSRPKAAWMPSPAAMARILQPAALPQWPIESDDLPSPAVSAAAARSHESTRRERGRGGRGRGRPRQDHPRRRR
eukprot:g58221.t1